MNKKIVALSKYPLVTGISLIVALVILIAGCKSGNQEKIADQKNDEKRSGEIILRVYA